MKLADALVQRADCQTLITSLSERLKSIAVVLDGESPVEDPVELLGELETTLQRMEILIAQINRTNAATEVRPGVTITDLIAHRDMCKKRQQILIDLASSAMPNKRDRMGRIDKVLKTTIAVPELRAKIAEASKHYRSVDSEIQQLNWKVDIIE